MSRLGHMKRLRRFVATAMRVHPIRIVRYSLILISSVLLYEIVTGIGRSGLRVAARLLAKTDSHQQLVDYVADFLRVQMTRTDVRQRHQIVLTNTGTRDIPLDDDWKIYFNLVSVGGDERLRLAYNLSIASIDGWLHSLQPTLLGVNHTTSESNRLRPNETITLPLHTDLKSKSYAFPRWYVVGGPDTKPRILQSTDGDSLDFVESFREDQSPHRYTASMDTSLTFSANVTATARLKPIIPTPLSFHPPPDKSMDASSPAVHIDAGWSIVYTEELYAEAVFIAAQLKLPLTKSNGQESNCIRMQIVDLRGWFASSVGNETFSSLHFQDAYVLRILRGGVVLINGQSAAGVFYGVQSLLSLLESSTDRRTLPVVTVTDAPRFAYRGLMLDVARNFLETDEVLRLLDVMAMYKMNKLHLHLTDDQGWRFEVPGLPELTEVGSHRGHVPGKLSDYDHLPAYLGSGPFLDNPAGNGYYTVSDYRRILQRASQLHVDVIPEIDLPGHSHAAIQSMRVRERRRQQERQVTGVPAQKNEESDADSYSLADPDDRSKYLAVNDYRDTVVNPCMESTFRFVEHVLRALKELHQDIQPLTVVHLGGDEVPRQALTASPMCHRLIKQRPELANRLKIYFMERAFNISSRLGFQVQTWEEGVIEHGTLPIKMSTQDMSNTYVQAWNNEPAYQRGDVAFSFANKGFKVILSHASHLYLDHPSESNRDELGLFWATRSSSLAKMFSYLPAIGDIQGSSVNGRICRMYSMTHCFNLTRPENIVGVEACLWSELIRNGELAEYMTLPRLLAVAERAWHVADWQIAENDTVGNIGWHRDWDEFKTAVGHRELRRLERIGMQYRLAPPGVARRGKTIHVSTEFAGQPVQFSADGGQSWNNWTSSLHETTAARSSTLQFITRSYDFRRRSRIVSVGVHN